MGFLGEIRKLLFVKKAVTKSAVDKSLDYTKEKAEEFSEVSKEMVKEASESAKNKASGLRDAIFEKTEDVKDSVKVKTESVVDSLKEKTNTVIENIQESEVVKQAASFTENLGDKILDTGEKTMEKLDDISEDLGEKWKAGKESIVEKAKDVTEKLSEKLDETLAKAKELEEQESNKPKSDLADTPFDASGSLFKEEDDFFSRASRYAKGEYGAFSEGKTTIRKIPEHQSKENKPSTKAAGFDDLDGDGDEIIDDAIIVSDQEE